MNYRPPRKRNLYVVGASDPFKLSRSKIENFTRCPRCFYLDRRLGIDQPPTPAFTLNTAVNDLLVTEFDGYRKRGAPHPIMIEHGLKAIPFKHEQLNKWRHNFTGVQFHHIPTNLLLTGAVDDLWLNEQAEIIVVDYKATAKTEEITLTSKWHESYKRQVEIYQWLLRQNGFTVNSTAYFVYCNGDSSKPLFEKRLEFRMQLIPHEGNTDWIEPTLFELHKCLQSDSLPDSNPECEYCNYRSAVRVYEHSSPMMGDAADLTKPQPGMFMGIDISELDQEVEFPWVDVALCENFKLDPVRFADNLPCPKCQTPAKELYWLDFNSPPETWSNMCGRKGPLSVCLFCKKQVQFICHIMN